MQDDKRQADARFEIVITPVMVEAGVASLECSECCSLEQQAIEAFQAMAMASPEILELLRRRSLAVQK